MTIQSLETAISKKTNPVGGVKVSFDLWQELNTENKIEEANFCPVGAPSVVISLPVLKGTKTVVWLDPDLNDKEFTLPPTSV
jgi:hypothetical protein